MLPTTHRSHRSTIPATGLGSILVASPQLALVADRAVVAAVAVAVGMGEEAFTAVDRRPWVDAAVSTDGSGERRATAGAAGSVGYAVDARAMRAAGGDRPEASGAPR